MVDGEQNGNGRAADEEQRARVYHELRKIAESQMVRERQGHTLQATALVHEAYLRLASDGTAWRDRTHFYATAAEAMRRILIEHARRAATEKRGGAAKRVTLGTADACIELPLAQMAELYEAIDRLAVEDPRAAAVTRLRFLSGLSVEETARELATSVRSVHREWRFARAWLFDRLGS
jgi:RNA polymerase sigma factor (TIGR02999 family)